MTPPIVRTLLLVVRRFRKRHSKRFEERGGREGLVGGHILLVPRYEALKALTRHWDITARHTCTHMLFELVISWLEGGSRGRACRYVAGTSEGSICRASRSRNFEHSSEEARLSIDEAKRLPSRQVLERLPAPLDWPMRRVKIGLKFPEAKNERRRVRFTVHHVAQVCHRVVVCKWTSVNNGMDWGWGMRGQCCQKHSKRTILALLNSMR